MSDSATGAGDGMRYRVTYTTRLSNLAAMFDTQSRDSSSLFFCHHDPESPMFALNFDYGKRDEGFFGVFVAIQTDTQKALAYTMQMFRLYDDKGKLLTEMKDKKRSPWKEFGDCGWGFTRFYKPVDASGETTWRIFIEFEYEKKGPSLPSTTSANDLQDDLLKLLENASNTDVTFVVKRESIKAHKTILCTRSQYFERMFASDVEENVTGEVKVPDVEPEVFKGLLHFLYSGLAPEIVQNKALDLLLVADKYGLDGLVKICEDKAPIHYGNVVDTLLVADSVKSEKLMSRAKAVFRSHVHELMASDVDADKLKSRPELMLHLIKHYAEH